MKYKGGDGDRSSETAPKKEGNSVSEKRVWANRKTEIGKHTDEKWKGRGKRSKVRD